MEKFIKRTKIVCTIGPASWDRNILEKMVENGMNVARINGAFADIPELERVAKLIRSVSKSVALMLDIKGHEVRLNKFDKAIEIKVKDEVIIGNSSTDNLYPITYPDLYKDIKSGQVLLIDKGEVKLIVKEIKDKKIFCEVVSGSKIESGKGVNIPGANLNNPAVTERDIEQIKFACDDGWDFIAGSFIRNIEDINMIKSYITNKNLRLISKIEDQQGVDNLEDILRECDGIMIARGDMGSEIPIEKLPIIQKMMILACNMAAKPVITATNMMESMTEKPFPTRAEVTDVANAILDGTDCVMTSGETSSGKYPAESIEMMSKIAVEQEKYLFPRIVEDKYFNQRKIAVSVSNASFELAKGLNVDVIVIFSPNDTLARLIARLALHTKIIALVDNPYKMRQLSLTKGVTAYEYDKLFNDRDEVITAIKKFLFSEKIVDKNSRILIVGKYKEQSPNLCRFTNILEFVET